MLFGLIRKCLSLFRRPVRPVTIFSRLQVSDAAQSVSRGNGQRSKPRNLKDGGRKNGRRER